LEQLKGKTVLIHFWATWCEPCKAEFAELQSLHAKYNKEGFEVVSVSVDESKEAIDAYLKENRLPWIHLYAEGGLEGSPLAAQLGVIALPTMIMIDREGKMIERGLSMTQVERELKKLAR
jgi:thiol-disulfide isomerase/thioredoxin